MEFGYIPFSQTAYKQIYKLKPGDILKFDIESLTMKYTNLSPLNEDNYSPSIDKKPDLHQLNDLVEKSALNWTISDVPFAVSLSDGLDSSLLVSILAEKSHSKFTTYTLNYKTNKNNFITSSPLIKKYKLDHIDVVIDGHDIANDIHEMVRALGEPYSGGLPSWFIYKEISQKYKVAVTGTGADELFGNYDKSKLIKKIEKFKIIGLYSLFQTFVRTFSFNTDITENARSIQESISKKIIKEDGTFINMLSKTDSLNLFLNTKNYSLNNKIIKSKFLTLEDYVFCFDFNTQLSDELLFMADRFSMHFSVESRAPFLDKDLIDYISTLDRKYFIKNGSKYYLRKIGEKWLTEDLLKNQKKALLCLNMNY
jgi:asparagine synthase (glutamine-hydrolysing)